jgi:hypothetical protein
MQITQHKTEYELRLRIESDSRVRDALKAKVEDLNSYERTIETCISSIRIHRDAKPYVVLGVPASFGLISSILSAALSFFAAVIALYSNRH